MKNYLILMVVILNKWALLDSQPHLFGLTVHLDSISFINDVALVPAMKDFKITFYGYNLSQVNFVSFTSTNGTLFSMCDKIRSTRAFSMITDSEFSHAIVNLRPFLKYEKYFYICLGQKIDLPNNLSSLIWHHQGYEKEVIVKVTDRFLPFWLIVILIVFLFTLSGIFSGLNLGLMSLSLNDLHLFIAAGSPNEKKYAKVIAPIRNHGNFLLATLLLGNVLVNSTLTVLVDELTGNGLMAVIGSTLGIVIFGEIIPQSVTSRHALIIGAKTMWITKLFMLITFVLSFPIGKILDKILGKELGVVYSREKLEILVKQQQLMGSVVKDEVNIITGALNLTTKTVQDIMTDLDDAFMIPYSSLLNFDLLNQIVRNGFTRIPVYEIERHNIKAVLNIKDLTLLDPDDNISVSTVCSFYKRPIMVVSSNTILREMLEEFKKGKTHLAFVVGKNQSKSNEKIIGLVTLEDVIEEIIQAEIIDETDVFTDKDRLKQRNLIKQDFSIFHESDHNSNLGPQQKLAALQHLYGDIDSFRENYISFHVLKSFLNANIVTELSFSSTNANFNTFISKGKQLDHAVLILSGRVSVSVSNENLYFETGPFMFFGETVLKNINEKFPTIDLNKDQLSDIVHKAYEGCSFIPDYSVVAVTDVQCLLFKIEHYIFARYLSQRKVDNNTMSNMQLNRAVSFQEEWNAFTKLEKNEFTSLSDQTLERNNNHLLQSEYYRENTDLDKMDSSDPDKNEYSDLEPLIKH